MLVSIHRLLALRYTVGLLVLGLLLPMPGAARGYSNPPVATSTPDEALPSAGPEIDAARQAYDQSYQHLRQTRKEAFEMGRLALTPLTQSLGMDPVINLDSGLSYSSLQGAINAATAGDTLEIIADLSEGPVSIDRNLFIQGATGGETIRATQDTGTSGDARGWFLVDAGIALVVRDLVFDGAGFKIYQAFRHRGLGLFERTHFRDIQFDASGPLYRGTAIVAFGDRVDVLSSTFEDIGRVGVLLFGTSVAGAIYGNNQYVGKGDGDFLDYGVELNAGATAWVLSNTFSDCRGVSADGFASAGILATTASGAGTVMVADSNHLLDNTFGLRAGAEVGDTTLAAAAFNRVVGNEFGITAGSDVAMDAQNNWWACNDGPGTPDCDIATVTGSGVIDADPWLVLQLDSQSWVKPHGHTALEASLTFNSDGANTVALGTVPDGIAGLFSPGSLGTVVPSVSSTVDGGMESLFIAGGIEGTTQTSVTVDNQIVERDLVIELGLFCDGFESGDTAEWDITSP